MQSQDKHIILMGFKHVGKSALGQEIAKHLARQFIDLDESVEQLYLQQFGKLLTCRQIVQQRGESFFRELETKALQQVIVLPPAIIALGGGVPLRKENQALLKNHVLVYITAGPEIVFNRIMAAGIPSFFDAQDPQGSFQRLWNERQPIYQELASFSVDNSDDLLAAVRKILEKLK